MQLNIRAMAEVRVTSRFLWSSTCADRITQRKTNRHAYLHSQADRVEHDEDKHDVLEGCGVHHVPELVLIGVFRDVAPQRSGLKRILHTLALWGGADRRRLAHTPIIHYV